MAVDVHVVTPEREIWAGPAMQVIAHGIDGDVGILSGHAPLLIQLTIRQLRISRRTSRGSGRSSTAGSSTCPPRTRVDVLATNGHLERSRRRRRAAPAGGLRASGSDDDPHRADQIASAEARLALRG